MKIVHRLWLSLQVRIHQCGFTLSFINWLAIANAVVFCFLCLPYLKIILSSQTLFGSTISLYTIPERIILTFGLTTAYLGQCALLAYLPTLLILLPLTLLNVHHRIVTTLAICLSAMSIIILLVDIMVFSAYHFHINIIFIPLFSKSYVSNTEWLWAIAISVIVMIVEMTLSYLIHRFVLPHKRSKQIGQLFAHIWPVILIASYSTYISSAQASTSTLAQQTSTMPLYNQVLAIMVNHSPWDINISKSSETLFAQPKLPTSKLFYPKHPLHCTSPDTPYNIVMIVIDAWRFDAFNEKLTPNLYRFAKQSWYFQDHVSGGNSTEAGLTSLLYGLPHLYWTSLRTAKRGTLLIDALQSNGYQTNVFFSSFMIPRFDETAFVKIPHLRTTVAPGYTIPDRDRTITKEWDAFIQHRDKQKPFFTFSLYNAAHDYCSEQNIEHFYPNTAKDCSRFVLTKSTVQQVHHRYLNAVHFLDNEIGFILNKLTEQKLLDKTIVIVTSDHGEEFHDTELKLLGHSSNYSIFQTRTPFILHWPGGKPATWAHATSHYDVIPTLMKEALHCDNPFTDYSIGGKILWDTHTKKDYVLAGSYLNSALLESKQRTILMASGNIEVTDLYGRTLANASVNQASLNSALNDLRWFYSPPKT